MAKFKDDSKTKKRIKKIVVSELKKNPKFLGSKELKICLDKTEGYNSKWVNIFIQQTNSKEFKVWLWNLSCEFNALFCIENALMQAFLPKHISTHMADSKSNHHAATVEFKL